MKILNTMPPYNLFGIDDQEYKSAKVVAIPIPYDSTTTCRAGTREGPKAIIEASRSMELYNEETGTDISKLGVYTTEEMAPDFSSPENMVARIEKEVKLVIEDNKLPLMIGGEHTISLGSVKALASSGRRFTFLHFDAHSDSRDTFMGSKFCHACVVARVNETCSSYSVGVRSIDEESARKYKDNMLLMKDMHRMGPADIIKSIIQNTDDQIYLSVDMDVLNPSEMPSVGTPEPDGMSFFHLKEVLKGILQEKDVVGMDFVELNPIPGLIAPNYLAAKLIFMALGYAFKE